MELKARLKNVFPMEQQTNKDGAKITKKDGTPFLKGGILLETEERYPKEIYLDVFNSDLLNNLKTETSITCSIDITSREYKGKYYTNATAWKIVSGQQAQEQTQSKNAPKSDDKLPENNPENDLPF